MFMSEIQLLPSRALIAAFGSIRWWAIKTTCEMIFSRLSNVESTRFLSQALSLPLRQRKCQGSPSLLGRVSNKSVGLTTRVPPCRRRSLVLAECMSKTVSQTSHVLPVPPQIMTDLGNSVLRTDRDESVQVDEELIGQVVDDIVVSLEEVIK